VKLGRRDDLALPSWAGMLSARKPDYYS
jgi:hypothetical protein